MSLLLRKHNGFLRNYSAAAQECSELASRIPLAINIARIRQPIMSRPDSPRPMGAWFWLVGHSCWQRGGEAGEGVVVKQILCGNISVNPGSWWNRDYHLSFTLCTDLINKWATGFYIVKKISLT